MVDNDFRLEAALARHGDETKQGHKSMPGASIYACERLANAVARQGLW